MSRDVIAELRGQDPARRAHLDAVDPGALAALREGITMTDRETTETNPEPVRPVRPGARRLGRRGVLVGGLAVVLAGGGVAYAASHLWGDAEGAATNTMGIECQEVFGVGYPNEGATVAATLTGDPVADCQTVRAEDGLAPMADPVAFTKDGTLYVTPRDQVPDGAEVLEVDPAAAARVRELRASLDDAVDGGPARCMTSEDAVAWAQTELDRLGITGWSVEVVHGSDDEGKYACSDFSVDPGVVSVFPGLEPPRQDDPLVAALRGIGKQCLTVDEAYDFAEAALGQEDHWPTTRVVDEDAACARVDLEGGGSNLVTVYGPTTVG